MEFNTYILLGFTGIIIFLGLILRKNQLLFILQAAWMIILVGCNSGGVDFVTNENIYRYATEDTITREGIFVVGYNWLAVIAKSMKVDYVVFNFILSTVATLLIVRTILKLSNNPCMVMSLIYIYPFVDNVVQKRWYYTLGIMAVAIPVLYEKRNKKYLLIYGLFCLLACQFHTAAVFYFLFVVFYLIPEQYKNKFIVTVFFVELLGINLLPQILMKLNLFGGRVNLYFNELAVNSSVIKFACWAVWHMACICVIYFAVKAELGREKDADFVWNINVLSLLILPLYSFDPVFSRLYRIIFIFNYIYITNKFVSCNLVVKRKALLVNLMQVAVTVGTFMIFYVLTGLGFNLVIPIFENNIFIEWLFK